mmetsp:Transcript_19172/g.33007  ORF Transcript_19172/g.33007 Transcript_19172/m.33007 type:complete len:320 (-) Transcript_19172:226-1185(-)|eukprot:CAMPEP_0119103768 /NCGR_PEP_ID=MMETSP1180-20130426/2139_1 /TAXON_ID=3052 ORGANISM="Chlamydomonas cf sp, Strain CCMP681" /NCGR_SAMPLE_ID=MMETSP1180 /ASSEMBLY_ACC=CAM_ASM_000741 /LENGTH=319 /DNA_ID=CAMNT_0007088355 /DNA_START=88 /DNA_END=1047 /DNA_ORIENTATION=-
MASTSLPRRPRVLVSNDDGINAPGLRELVKELVKADFCDVHVCAPSGERSAQSHAITLGRYLAVAPADVPGTIQAFAVDGTPADSVMLAMHSPLLGIEVPSDFDLVLSGINRGDNCGLHVIYSGTVGAAREAACKGVPAIAFSLDNHMARKVGDYTMSAQVSVSIAKAALGLLPGQQADAPPCLALVGAVLNVNFPISQGQMMQGLYQTHQSMSCVFPAYKEVLEGAGPHLPEIDEHTPNSRMFRNFAGTVQGDNEEGGDAWAMRYGWVSVTPLGLRQDIVLGNGSTHKTGEAVTKATSAIIVAAAADCEIATGGISKM